MCPCQALLEVRRRGDPFLLVTTALTGFRPGGGLWRQPVIRQFSEVLEIDNTTVQQVRPTAPVVADITGEFEPLGGKEQKLGQADRAIRHQGVGVGKVNQQDNSGIIRFDLGKVSAVGTAVERIRLEEKLLQAG